MKLSIEAGIENKAYENNHDNDSNFAKKSKKSGKPILHFPQPPSSSPSRY